MSMSSGGSGGDYQPLLTGDYGFILSVALTTLICLTSAFLIKVYFTLRKMQAMKGHAQGSAATAIMVADVMWLIAHLFAFIYFGLRIATLKDVIEDVEFLSSAQMSFIASENTAAHIFFLLSLYLSSCSVLCAAIAIPDVAKPRNSILKSPTYAVPFVVFLLGSILATFPRFGCSSQYIFPGMQHLCSESNGRILPAMVVIAVVDVFLAVYWFNFVFQKTVRSTAGKGSVRRQVWPVAPFALRLIVVGAIVAYMDVYARFSRGSIPYHNIFYPELLALTISLMATSSVSLSRVLGKLNFVGVAYNVDPAARSQLQSGSASKERSGRASVGAAKALPNVNNGWRDQSMTLFNNVRAERRTSLASSEEQILGDDAIRRTVDIHQVHE